MRQAISMRDRKCTLPKIAEEVSVTHVKHQLVGWLYWPLVVTSQTMLILANDGKASTGRWN